MASSECRLPSPPVKEIGGDHVVPEPVERVEQGPVAGLQVDVGGSGGQIRHADRVPGDRGQLTEGQVVLEVLRGKDAVLQVPVPASVDEQACLGEVVAVTGLPVQLDQGHLHLGVAAGALFTPLTETAYRQVGESHGHFEEPAVTHPPVGRYGGLDQVAEVVQLVAPSQVLPGLLGRRRVLEERVQVTVRGLHPLQETDHLLEELPYAVVRFARPDLVRQAFERLVQVGVEERVTPAIGRGIIHEQPAQVVHVARGAQLPDGVRDGRPPVPVLPVTEEAAGDAHGGQRDDQ
jgi:hypothetical protein